MSNRVHSVLSKKVLRVDAAESLSSSIAEIRRSRASHVAIFDHERCLSVSSLSDIELSSDDVTFGDLVEGQSFVDVSNIESVDELGRLFADANIEAQVVHDDQGKFVGVVTRQSLLDGLLRERKQTEQSKHEGDLTEYQRSESLLAGEKRILEIISTSSSQDGGLTELVEFVESQSDGAYCSIQLIDDNGSRLWNGAAISLPDDFVRAIDGIEIGPAAGACGTAAFLNETVIVSDIGNDPRCTSVRELALTHELSACSSSPIQSASGKVLGTIAMYFTKRQSPSAFQMSLIDRAIPLAAIAIERRNSEETLRASEARHRRLLEGSPVCTKIIDLDSRLQYMSAAGKNQLKICDIEPYYGNIFPSELYPEPWRTYATEHLNRSMQGEITNLECPVLDTEGNEVWFDTTFVPAHDESGRIQHIIVTSVNVTDRRQAEEEARKHRDDLAHVSRVSTMGELATGIAHELNQPLAAIAAYSCSATMMVNRPHSDSHKLREILCKLEDQAIRAGEIVRRLRGFVTKTEPVRERADLNAIVQEVAKFVEPEAHQTDTVLKLNLDELSPVVVIDRIQIQQVLVNLIRNAFEAMAQTATDHREVTVSTRVLQGNQTEVSVSDTGEGLAESELEKVFDAFFSTKQEGMGMGLPISRSIVESHGGQLVSKANNGPGTTFRFTILQEDGDAPDQHPTVFIVDDESAVRDSLCEVVRSSGYSARCFSSAIEFLDVIETHDIVDPACLIVDVQMPKINGIELLEKLNTLNKKLPVILTTGHSTLALEQKAKALGAVAFIEKPFRAAKLQELLTTSFAQYVGEEVQSEAGSRG